MTNFMKTIGVSMLALLLLSACNSAQSEEAAENSSNNTVVAADTNASTEEQGSPGEQMDEGQMEMMSTFRSLIMMDEQDGLAITEAQAESMLPIVQEAVDQNELTDEQKTSLTAELTEDQQAYLTESAEQMPTGPRGNDGEAGAPGNGEQPSGDAPAAGDGTPPADGAGTPPADGSQQPPAEQGQDGTSTGERPERGAGPDGGADIGAQLIELLNSKISGTSE